MSFLLDVNVLLALCWEELEFHSAARTWFSRHATKSEWATCALTESAFLRLSMNPRLFPVPATFREALGVLDALRMVPGHRFLEQSGPFTESDLPSRQVRGYKQVVDATLLGLARRSGSKFATFDRGLETLASGAEWKKSLVLIE